MRSADFQPRKSVAQVEEGTDFAPKFGDDGLLTCVISDAYSGDVPNSTQV